MNSKTKISLLIVSIAMIILMNGCNQNDTSESKVVIEEIPVIKTKQDNSAQKLEAPPVAPALN